MIEINLYAIRNELREQDSVISIDRMERKTVPKRTK